MGKATWLKCCEFSGVNKNGLLPGQQPSGYSKAGEFCGTSDHVVQAIFRRHVACQLFLTMSNDSAAGLRLVQVYQRRLNSFHERVVKVQAYSNGVVGDWFGADDGYQILNRHAGTQGDPERSLID